MTVYYSIIFFILGMLMGSFYNVVGYRVPKKESILFPSSHCTNCNHKLSILDLFPVFSYIFLGGKCRYCKNKISIFYPIFEFISGLLFMLSFLIFGLSLECLFAITFVSLILIIVISDLIYMIIDDLVLLIFSILLLIEIFLMKSFDGVLTALINGLISFAIMFSIKLIGDFLFKRESMGGGDIKLLFVFGLVLGFPMSILSIFLASIIGLPISLILLKKNSNHEVPFGPFLGIAAIILLFSTLDFNSIMTLISFY